MVDKSRRFNSKNIDDHPIASKIIHRRNTQFGDSDAWMSMRQLDARKSGSPRSLQDERSTLLDGQDAIEMAPNKSQKPFVLLYPLIDRQAKQFAISLE
ncbi:hypothetical protein RBSWK_01925 [Rhodopirellula baltica SWK14]|uniref:Uncharacterized protein n=1 Tax=Rhodopirellula baltica SWK14 TaxID=993516 RepID=L7CKG9_RHOBT|nr:hypothetical protein RBSWK_01925 [Rhodopirellula baltica SWK14]